jgi:uncharacterized protein (UPF0332 family)
MNIEFKECLNKGKIKEFSRGPELAIVELNAAESDLKRANKTLEEKDYKWTTVQVYYSMFHTARALLYSKKYREHSHYCLILSLRVLFTEAGVLSVKFVEKLQEAKRLREDADYYNRWSQNAAEEFVKIASEFIEEAKKLI